MVVNFSSSNRFSRCDRVQIRLWRCTLPFMKPISTILTLSILDVLMRDVLHLVADLMQGIPVASFSGCFFALSQWRDLHVCRHARG